MPVPVRAGAHGFAVKNGHKACHWGTGVTSSKKCHFCFILFSRETSAAYTWHFLLSCSGGLYGRKIKEGEVILSLEEHLQDWAERASSLAIRLKRHDPAARSTPAPALGQVELGRRALNVTPSSWPGSMPLGAGEPRRALGRGMAWLLCALGQPLAQRMKRKDWGEAREGKAAWGPVTRGAKGQPGSGVNPHTEFTSSWAKADAEIQKELVSHHGSLGSPALAQVFISIKDLWTVEQLAPAPSHPPP